MKTPAGDTTPQVHKMWISLMRGMKPCDRLARMRSLSGSVIELSRRAIARAHPDQGQMETGLLFVELHYGKPLADKVRAYLGGAGK